MRLSCPNCGAEYDVPEGMVPGAGRHVQCSACHTRWFVRGGAPAAPGAASEDQILNRLENWRPRPVAVPPQHPAAAPGPVQARPRSTEPLRVVPTTTEKDSTAAEVTPDSREQRPAPPLPSSSHERPTKPADRPTVARPTPVPVMPARPAPRLELDGAPSRVEVPPARRSRFLHGFLLVAVLAAAAFAVWRFAGPIASAVPAAAPTLDVYADTIDAWREDVERLIAPFRPNEAG